MKEEVLPAGFSGTFYFTNFSKEEFRARWNKKEYIFPPESTVPLIILDATPLEVQNIRKKFAKELAEREFYNTERYKSLHSQNPMHQLSSFKVAIGYQGGDLEPLIKQCLEPLPVKDMKVERVITNDEQKFHKDEEGKPISRVVEQGTTLVAGTQV